MTYTLTIPQKPDVRSWTDDAPKTHWGALILMVWFMTQLAAGCLAVYQGFSIGATLVCGWFGAFYLVGSLLTYLFGLL